MVIPIKSSPPKVNMMDKQEFVGNCKEFRIEMNKVHLRIVGNGNKVKVNSNYGHLEIIGNDTRVKITSNEGQVTYIGNNGKVYLGKYSTVTDVNYIGNCGILKLVTSTEDLCREFKTQSMGQSGGSKQSYESSKPPSRSKCHKPNRRRHTSGGCYSGDESTSQDFNFQDINRNHFCLYVKNNISMPNLEKIGCNARVSNSIKITSSTSNIIVNNTISI